MLENHWTRLDFLNGKEVEGAGLREPQQQQWRLCRSFLNQKKLTMEKPNMNTADERAAKRQKTTARTVERVLEERHVGYDKFDPDKTGVLYKVAVRSDPSDPPGFCYFMINRNVKFRHNGITNLCPPAFLVSSSKSHQNDTVLMYFTSSGSGKTVDLATSSYTREADVALLLGGMVDSDSLRGAQKAYIDACKEEQHLPELKREKTAQTLSERNRIGQELLVDGVAAFGEASEAKATLGALRECLQQEKLKIVMCLDEVYSCPILVRTIIANRSAMGEAVAKALFPGNVDSVSVLFSCAGTGATRSSVGSSVDNFDVVDPAATKDDANKALFDQGVKKVVNDEEEKEPIKLIFPDGQRYPVTYANVKKHLPFVKVLLDNGRMNSIASLEFNRWDTDTMINEARLVHEIIDSYIISNGLNDLQTPEQRMLMGASALATILFQPDGGSSLTLPKTVWELEEWHASGRACGFDFSKRAKSVPTGTPRTPVVAYLLGRLGLIEPSKDMPWRVNQTIKKPYKMNPPQELVALVLLGIDLKQLLRLDSFGFEVLTTHLIKCALAAACVVKLGQRPSVKRALAGIGFQPHKKKVKGKKEKGEYWTDEAVWKKWDELDLWLPQFHVSRSGENDLLHRNTHFMSVGLDAFEANDGEEYLRIDPSLLGCLSNMEELEDDEDSVEDPFFAPFASLNYGNSPLFDGGVAFLAVPKDPDLEAKMFTVMNQAKDYGVDTRLQYSELKKHAERCNKKVLDGVFGSDRLLCLSGRKEVVTIKNAKYTKYGRPFLPFLVNDSNVLKALLILLDEKRTKGAREKEAKIVDKEGNDVTSRFQDE